MSDNVNLVRRAWEAALAGDVDAVAGLLAEGVRWHAAGDADGGCQNRTQALRWMRAAIERGAAARVLELRELDERRVLVVLERAGAPEPHAQS
jgi:hypothetical protein